MTGKNLPAEWEQFRLAWAYCCMKAAHAIPAEPDQTGGNQRSAYLVVQSARHMMAEMLQAK